MRRQIIKRVRPVAKNCPYCASKIEPDYKEESLKQYLTERGKMLSAARTGLCSKHQRHVAESIKRARQVALLPFLVRA